MRHFTRRPVWLVLAAPLLVLTVLSGAAPPAGATTTATLNATGRGWYSQAGYHDAGNSNYVAGTNTNPPYDQYRDFFVFDLSGVTGATISSATLRAPNPNAARGTGTYALHAVSTAISSLTASQAAGATGEAIYADLGDGTVYGSFDVTTTNQTTNPVDVTINAAGLAALNSSEGGSIAFGGDYPGGGVVFSGSDSATNIPQLILEVSSTVPSAPAGVSAKVVKVGHGKYAYKDGVNLSWTDGTTGGATITDHFVQVYTVTKGALPVPSGAPIDTNSASTSFTVPDNAFASGGTYAFEVAAVNIVGTGAYSGISRSVRY